MQYTATTLLRTSVGLVALAISLALLLPPRSNPKKTSNPDFNYALLEFQFQRELQDSLLAQEARKQKAVEEPPQGPPKPEDPPEVEQPKSPEVIPAAPHVQVHRHRGLFFRSHYLMTKEDYLLP